MTGARTLLLVALLVGCDDDTHVRHLPDGAAIDVSSGAFSFVGSWSCEALFGQPARTITFGADSTFHDGASTATWRQIDDDEVEYVVNSSRRVIQYYSSPDGQTLVWVSLKPITATDGVIGTWSNTTTYGESDVQVQTQEMLADQTCIVRRGALTEPCTWQLTGTSLRMVMDSGTADLAYKVIPDVAMGRDLCHRTP